MSLFPKQEWLIGSAEVLVRLAGAHWVGIQERLPGQEPLALFNVPNGSTLSLPLSEVSLAAVRKKIGGQDEETL